MRSILTFLIVLCAFGNVSAQQVSAWQVNEANMGPAYSKDVYRKLGNSYHDSANGTAWTLSFQIIPQGGPSSNVAIFANHGRQNATVYSLGYSASSMFASLTAADTIGRTSKPLYNSDTTWALGALNQTADPNDPFDYSWGQYNLTTHNVTGDSLYLIKTTAATYKLWVQRYVSFPLDSIRYEFRIAQFDGSQDTTIKLYRRNGFTNSLFAYYDAANRVVRNLEPARNNWDLAFTRYVERATQGTTTMMYPVMGVLHNVGVEVAEAQGMSRDSALSMNTSNQLPYSKKINTIGSDWKSFIGQTGPWVIDSNHSYFIKSPLDNTIYQLIFTGFGGSTTGKIQYKTRTVGTFTPIAVAAVNAAPEASVLLAPNPASGSETHVLIEAPVSFKGRILVTDAMGRALQNNPVTVNSGLNAFRLPLQNMPSGNYFITVTDGAWKQTQQLLVP